MAGNENMSVEEILAACRAADGEGGGAAEAEVPDSSPEPAAESAGDAAPGEETPQAKPAAVKATGEMSVEEMLAAARAEKSGDKPAAAASSDASSAKPAAKPAAAGSAAKKPGQMTVEEMLAAARGEKSGGGKATDPKKGSAKKPAVKAGAAKAGAAKAAGAKATAKPAAKAPSGPKDTASILAAARSAAKPGPISKAEAAERPAAAVKKEKPKPVVPPMPEKPGYARAPAPAATAGDEDRRGFLGTLTAVFVGSSLAVGFSSLAVTHILWLLGLARYMFPNILTEPPTQFKVGFPDALAPGQVETKYKAQFGVWVVRAEYDGMPQIFALQSVCTHLGCTPNWLEGEQKFKCPCHGSGFYKDGINFEGPAPRPLERFAIRIADDGQLEVDKSRKFKEEVGQWGDSASFVPV